MAETPIGHEEIFGADVLAWFKQEIASANTALIEMEKNLQQVGIAAGKNLGKGNPNSAAEMKAQAQAIKEIEQAEKQLNDVRKAKLVLDNQEIKNSKELEKLKREKIKTKQAEEKASAANTRALGKEKDAYGKLSAEVAKLKRESQNLGAQMTILEKAGKQNTRTYSDLALKYKEVTAAASAADTNIKKIDSNVGNSQRNVGNYKDAIVGMYGALRIAANIIPGLGISGLLLVGWEALVAVVDFFKTSTDASAESVHLFREELTRLNTELSNVGASLLQNSIDADVSMKKLTTEAGEHKKNALDLMIKVDGEETKFRAEKSKRDKQYAEDLRSSETHIINDVIYDWTKRTAIQKAFKSNELTELAKHQTLISNLKRNAAEIDIKISADYINGVEKDKEKATKTELDYDKILRDLRTENLELEYERRKKTILDNYDDESKKFAGHTAILVELEIKKTRSLTELWQMREWSYEKIMREYAEQQKKELKLAEMKEDDPVFSKKVAYNIERHIKYVKHLKEQHKKELEEIINNAKAITDAIEKELDRRYEIKVAADNHDIDRANRNVEVQTQLAAAGRQNVLAEELAAADRAEQKKLDDAKKHAKEQEAVELGKLLIQLTAAYAKEGDTKNPEFKALATVLVTKGLANSIAGYFAGGVEDFKGKGTGTSDSNIIGFSSGESVVTAKGTAETPGLVTALNESGMDGATKWAMDNIYLPQFNSMNLVKSGRAGENMYGFQVLSSKLEEVKKSIENRPVSQNNLGRLSEWTERTHRKGIEIAVHHKKIRGRI